MTGSYFLFHFILLRSPCCVQPTPLFACASLQFVEPCSGVRYLGWTALEGGIRVWLPSAMVAGVRGVEEKGKTTKESRGSKPVLFVKGPGSKWRNALPSALSGRSGSLCQPDSSVGGRLWAGHGLADPRGWGPGSLSVCPGAGSSSSCASRSLCCEVECM